jgi:hypothetical protein
MSVTNDKFARVCACMGPIYEEIANSHKSLQRGMVWCKTCGRSQRVDSASALRNGWPKCCGHTMTIDSPDEQKRFSSGCAPSDSGREGS